MQNACNCIYMKVNVLDQFWENLFEHHSQNFDNGFETFLRLLWVETIMEKWFCGKTFPEMTKISEESIMKGNNWFIIILSAFLNFFLYSEVLGG